MKKECSRCEYANAQLQRDYWREGTLEPDDLRRPTCAAIVIAAMVLAVVGTAIFGCVKGCEASAQQDLAERKCRIAWESINDESYRPELADWFVEIHYRAGMGPRWPHSLAYCWSGSGLNPRMVSRATINGEHALGLVDTLWSTHRGNLCCVRATVQERGVPWTKDALHDPYVAIRLHVLELVQQRDDDAWRNLRRVFLPLSPDSDRAVNEQTGRWEPRMTKIEAMLEQARKDGKL